jgi:hypothetical protein
LSLVNRGFSSPRSRPTERLFSQQGLSQLNQLSEFLLLIGDARRIQIFDAGARIGSGLFNLLVEILPDSSDALVQFGKRQSSLHRRIPLFPQSSPTSCIIEVLGESRVKDPNQFDSTRHGAVPPLVAS